MGQTANISNYIYGWDFNDTLTDLDGNDILDVDKMIAGKGNDICFVDNNANQAIENTNEAIAFCVQNSYAWRSLLKSSNKNT